MVESAYTPGPWMGAGPSFGDPLPRYTNEILTAWEDDDGEVVSICYLPVHDRDAENEANALLIAAAPELLEALARYVHHFGDPLKCARAAIAKATGGQISTAEGVRT